MVDFTNIRLQSFLFAESKIRVYKKIFSPLFLISLFIALTIWSWRKWPDIMIDFGRELYLPWQISMGKVLYRDIGHFFGPFSQYFNAFLFTIFGPSYTTLFIVNLILLAILTIMIFKLIKVSTDKLTATLTTGIFLSIFAFSHLTYVGNYNFISPYSHESTHGIILSVGMIYALCKSITKRSNIYLFMAGLCCGMASLTKIDIILAVMAVIVCWFFIDVTFNQGKFFTAISHLAIIILAAIIPNLMFLLYFTMNMPFIEALKSLFLQWIILLTTNVDDVLFYKLCIGTNDPAKNIFMMFLCTLGISLYFMLIFRLCSLYHFKKNTPILKWLYFSLFGLVIISSYLVSWAYIGRSLPILSFSILVIFIFVFVKVYSSNKDMALKLTPMILWASFSTFLLIKIILNARLFHYGFYLAMPSFLLFTVCIIFYLPRFLNYRYSIPQIFKHFMIGFIIICTLNCLKQSHNMYKNKTFNVSLNGDTITTFSPNIDQRSEVLSNFLSNVDTIIPEDATLAVLPEGVMLNYLTRRVNPTGFITFMLPEIMVFGEDTVLRSFKENAPDFIILFHKDTSEYGVNFFGQDERYGKLIMDWIKSEYTPVLLIGHEPLQDSQCGLKIMKKRHLFERDKRGAS